jgi:hypothetical protein
MERARGIKTAKTLSEHVPYMKTFFSLSISTVSGILMHWIYIKLYFVDQRNYKTSNAGTHLNAHTLFLQPKHNYFTSNSIQGRTGLSLCMCYRFAVFPLPLTCAFVTVIKAWSYFASTVFCTAKLLCSLLHSITMHSTNSYYYPILLNII